MRRGFTLAELLIALAILGVIATFTIPKVLQSQQDSTYKAIGKETASLLSGAFDAYRLKNSVTANTNAMDLTPYINYVKLVTGGVSIDGHPGSGTTYACAAATPCMLLHNGALLRYRNDNTFGGTTTEYFIHYLLDPDAKASSVLGLRLYIYTNGRIVDRGQAPAGSISYEGGAPSPSSPTPAPVASETPSWFNWN